MHACMDTSDTVLVAVVESLEVTTGGQVSWTKRSLVRRRGRRKPDGR
jgi:hypothetical protein